MRILSKSFADFIIYMNNSHLGGLDNVLNEDDGLESGEQSVDASACVLHCTGQLGFGDLDVNIQECLVERSLNLSTIQNLKFKIRSPMPS